MADGCACRLQRAAVHLRPGTEDTAEQVMLRGSYARLSRPDKTRRSIGAEKSIKPPHTDSKCLGHMAGATLAEEAEARSAPLLLTFLSVGLRGSSLRTEKVREVPDHGVGSVFLGQVSATWYRLQLRTGDGLMQLLALL